MTGTIEIKLTVSEVATPALFAALMAVSNPRQRAALLKRLADDALRGQGSVVLASTVDRSHSVNRPNEVTWSETAVVNPHVSLTSVDDRQQKTLSDDRAQTTPVGDEDHMNYLADSLSAFAY